jgi:hypothetical protein
MKFLAPVFLFLAAIVRAQSADPEAAMAAPGSGSVQVWQTSADGSQRLTRLSDLAWTAGLAAGATNVTVNDAVRYQQIDGFGASILDSSLWDADPAVRDEVMGDHRAASTLVTVPALARAEWLIEISLVAAA